MTAEPTTNTDFRDFGLAEPIMKALQDVGYETATPIQEAAIPAALRGRDIIGTAQTGTGKTAAFALPLLSKINLKLPAPQVLVLTPTRELAIQVAEAFQKYAVHLKGFHVLPIYGGADYGPQLRGLRRGAHVIVGTPGRVMDHMEREALSLDSLTCLVLDEADEMLRMGFKEDVEWVLDRIPEERQISLFSATIPAEIRSLSKRYLNDPVEVTIKARTTTVEATRQRYWLVSGIHKLDALTRILEAETYEGIIIFVRTKIATLELAEKLAARGFAAAPLNGDIAQTQRERTIDQLRTGKLNILVATDVAARGLDVERVSHVINYDIPYDVESYIHRIGRTGRAGRSGEAILFVAPKERRILQVIERATRQQIPLMELPTTDLINDRRVSQFKQKITESLTGHDLAFYRELLETFTLEQGLDPLDVAAALARLYQGDTPMLLPPAPVRPAYAETHSRSERPPRHVPGFKSRDQEDFDLEEGMERFRLEIGHRHNVLPGNIVGAIAGESGLHSRYIGRIKIHQEYSTVDLPVGMPDHILEILQRAWISGRQLNLSRMNPEGDADETPRGKKGSNTRDAKEPSPIWSEVKPKPSVERRARPARSEAADRDDWSERPGHSGRSHRRDRLSSDDERPSRPERSERSERDERSDRTSRSDSSERSKRERHPAEPPIMGRPRTGRPPRFEREEASNRSSRRIQTAEETRGSADRPRRGAEFDGARPRYESPRYEKSEKRADRGRKPARAGEARPRRRRV